MLAVTAATLADAAASIEQTAPTEGRRNINID